MTTRTTRRCRYCGRALMNAETGRPRLFCNEFHRKWYAKATADQAAALVAEADATCAVREIRDLQHDLLALLATCQRLARRLELVGDVVTRARIAAVADELGRTLARHFAAQEQP